MKIKFRVGLTLKHVLEQVDVVLSNQNKRKCYQNPQISSITDLVIENNVFIRNLKLIIYLIFETTRFDFKNASW